MKHYGDELRYRRGRASLTIRDLAQLIDTSPTYVTDFENAKKSNPPDPPTMQRIAAALNWPVSDQLSAWGYADRGQPTGSPGNPFPSGDRRRDLFDAIDWDNEHLLVLLDELLTFLHRSRDAGAVPAHRQEKTGNGSTT